MRRNRRNKGGEEMSAAKVLYIARMKLTKHYPYWTMPLYRLIPMEIVGDPQVTLFVTDKMVMGYNPDYIVQIGIDRAGGSLIHELSHVLRKHHKRARMLGVNTKELAKLWNYGADCEINDGHPQEHLPLPDGVLYPSTFGLPEGKLAEFYFREICKLHKQGKLPQGLDPNGDGQGQPGQPGEEGQEGRNGQPGSGGDQASGVGHEPAKGGCGSCAGNPMPGEPKDGKTPKGVGRSAADVEHIRKVVAEAVQAHEKSHGVGSVPGSWSVWAGQELKPPKVPWRQQVARITRRTYEYVAGLVDFRFDQPSRKQGTIGYGLGVPVLPRMIKPKPEVTFVGDTSGSMCGAEDIQTLVSEVRGILKALGVPINFGVCDAAMQGPLKKVVNIKDAIQHLKGGGGTSFLPIFEALKKTKPKTDLLIIGTDGGGQAPDSPPRGTQVLWVIIGKHGQRPYDSTGKPISWGTFLFLDIDDFREENEEAA